MRAKDARHESGGGGVACDRCTHRTHKCENVFAFESPPLPHTRARDTISINRVQPKRDREGETTE